MSNSTSASTNLNVQFYDNENYHDICENILNINKNLIHDYLKELNEIPKDLDNKIDNKIIELKRISQSKEKKNKKLIRDTVKNIVIKEYKTNVKIKYNRIWNSVLIKSLNIKPITTIRNDDYINFYD